ncbi:hypothetical protein T265_09779 [Opisthorchis viverrini]|uniref:Uncharacterized protein n=1 Tax=Opisthorchis viverrini TaxID=6198 RepID=A0A074ZFL3_OPIVI|nr:hypothetical protein T265_09779 [Opisthorchis viverrini]KER22025.1 hypothetical protein T265_09779 [Opisthorchis viverrini]
MEIRRRGPPDESKEGQNQNRPLPCHLLLTFRPPYFRRCKQQLQLHLCGMIDILSVYSCYVTRRKYEDWDTARLSKPRQRKSRGKGQVRNTDHPVNVTPFRCLAAMSLEGSTRAGILPGCPSLDRGCREADLRLEQRAFWPLYTSVASVLLSCTPNCCTDRKPGSCAPRTSKDFQCLTIYVFGALPKSVGNIGSAMLNFGRNNSSSTDELITPHGLTLGWPWALFAQPREGWKSYRRQTVTWHGSIEASKLSCAGHCRLPGWGPRDRPHQWLGTLSDMAQSRPQCLQCIDPFTIHPLDSSVFTREFMSSRLSCAAVYPTSPNHP